jgi:hypothetical protein
MKQKKPAKQKITLEQEMLKDIGKGTSQWPSNNASVLDLNELEWRWIDAVYAADRNRDPRPLIDLLKAAVPKRVMLFVEQLLLIRLGRKPGRPSILPTRKFIAYHCAQEEVRELVEQGMSVIAAVEETAPKWGLTPKALTSIISGKSGYSRKTRR